MRGLIENYLLPGMNLGFSETYTTNSGVISRRTTWMRCEEYDPVENVVSGYNLNTDELLAVEACLIHTACSPFEHL